MTGSDKAALRVEVWDALRAAKKSRFPGARGRIPNFVGAEAAADRLAETPEWAAARAIKINPDSPQRPVRHRALKANKRLFVPVPKLADERAFVELDPARLEPGDLWSASSIKGAAKLGRPVRPEEVPALDLIVTGCVGVGRRGERLGKGGGYSDLEYAILRELGLVSETTPIATTVHDLQILLAIPMTAHDFALDLIATPIELVRVVDRVQRPKGVLWSHLSDEKIASIPVLAARYSASEAGTG